MTCPACKTTRFMEFECVECCLRWLQGMDKKTMAENAHMIERVAGAEQMKKVRAEWQARGYQPKGST